MRPMYRSDNAPDQAPEAHAQRCTSEDMAAELSVIIHRLPDHEVRQGAPEMRVGPCSCTQHMPLVGMRTHDSMPTR
jgi:hypothetical protein